MIPERYMVRGKYKKSAIMPKELYKNSNSRYLSLKIYLSEIAQTVVKVFLVKGRSIVQTAVSGWSGVRLFLGRGKRYA